MDGIMFSPVFVWLSATNMDFDEILYIDGTWANDDDWLEDQCYL